MRKYFFLYKKCILIFFIMSVPVQSQEVYNLPPIELIKLLQEITQLTDGDVEEADVTFFLSTRRNLEYPQLISKENNYQLDVKKPTKFIIHGWVENYKVGWYAEMKDELLKYEDVNVIYVDWKKVARSYYISAAKNTILVGSIIGRFIVESKFPPENVHLIGHSLGSHIAGFTAKYIKRAIGSPIKRISALDPAGPYFRLSQIDKDGKLNAIDANIVDVLHTDGEFFGFYGPIGTLDIYVNRGVRRQPGCHDGELSLDIQEMLKNTLCSHARSYVYYIQSINNADIICKKCQSFENFLNNDCSNTDLYRIVHQNVTEDMKGICTVSTDSSPPYFVN